MCGIAGIYLKDSFKGQYNIEDLVDGLLLGIEHRGRDATGYVAVKKGGEVATFHKDDIAASHFTLLRDFLPEDMRFALLHTRLATQGDPDKMENNHPVQFKTCFATHNGVIYNDATLFDDELSDVERIAEVDSIVVPTLIASCGGMENALEVLPKLKGSWALAIADPTEKPDEVLLVRGERSPLVVLNHPKLIMWASTQGAIKDAWEMAIGTPPKWNKYTTIDEGCYVRIKEGGLVETGRFIEKPTYQSRNFRTPHTWERDAANDSAYEYASATNYSVPYTSMYQDRPECYQCGEHIAFYTVRDTGPSREDGWTPTWDVPVCFRCRQTVAADLHYRYANGSGLRTYFTRTTESGGIHTTERCALCEKAPASATTHGNDRVCEECFELLAEAVGNRHLVSFRGDDPNADKFLTLGPGDIIPFEMRSAFQKGCESCSSRMVSHIGKDGFAICGLCYSAELADEEGEGIECLKCDVCEFWYPTDTLAVQSPFGTVCKQCMKDNDWSLEDWTPTEECGVEVFTDEKRPSSLARRAIDSIMGS